MLSILTNPYVLLGILVAWCGSLVVSFGYAWHLRSGEVSAANDRTRVMEERYTTLVGDSNARFEKLKSETTGTLENATKDLKALDEKLKEKDDDLQAAIRNNDSLRRTVLSRNTVRLFNASTAVGHTGSGEAKPDQTVAARVVQEATDAPSASTLADLISVADKNNLDHIACVKQVEGLQNAYNAVYNAFQP